MRIRKRQRAVQLFQGGCHAIKQRQGAGICGPFCAALAMAAAGSASAAPTETVLHSFTGSDAGYPFAGLIADRAGNLYGTTQNGGASGWGTVFKLSPSGTETVLYSFGASQAF
jgi:uncharacterized repeat protein (TIGR03803 family)